MPTPTHKLASCDAILFGGGLAGCILAERLIAEGKRVLLVDNPRKSCCSRIAAGMMNPISGKRLKQVWQATTFIPHAIAYYQGLESRHQQSLYHPRAIHRLFANSSEPALWQQRLQDPSYSEQTKPLSSARPEEQGFVIPQAGYLDTKALLTLLKAEITRRATLLHSTFNYEEIEVTPSSVAFRQHQAPLAIFAEGHLATGNPYFQFVPYRPAKGLIATFKTSDPRFKSPDAPILLKGKFIIPRHDGTLQVGATYNWDDSTETPDASGIHELERFLDLEIGSGNWNFQQVRAGVRPATAGAYPVVGPHPEHPNLFAFNGFGSKGAQQIPYLADALSRCISQSGPLPPETLPARFLKTTPRKPKRWLATEIAQATVTKRLSLGQTVIDATAGNGHDTQWLAEAVGPNGHVFAYDIQKDALRNTRQRLLKSGLAQRVTLTHSGHQALLATLPSKHHGHVAAIVFNLGYLPGGDPQLMTRPATTIAALGASLRLLKPSGILSITLYPAHPGAKGEVEEVLSWSRSLDPKRYQVQIEAHPRGNPNSPYPLFVTKI